MKYKPILFSTMKRLRCFFRFLYTLDAYKGVEPITLWDHIYAKRIGIRRAWFIAKSLHP